MSADQKTYLTCSLNSNNYLLDVHAGKILNIYNDPSHYHHTTYKSEAVFHSNNKHIIGGSEDGSIILWNIITAKVDHIILSPLSTTSSSSSSSSIHPRDSQSKAISSIAMHPTKTMFITSSYYGTAKIWEEESVTTTS